VVTGVSDPDGEGPLRGREGTIFAPEMDPATTTDPTRADSDGVEDRAKDSNRNGRVDPGESGPGDPQSLPPLPEVPALSVAARMALAIGLACVAWHRGWRRAGAR